MAGAILPTVVAIHLVGRLSVVLDGRVLDDKLVGSRKARTLLAVLAAEPTVRRDAEWLAERLWPEDAPKDPANNVATLVSRLRSVLGPGAIVGDRAGWRLGDVEVDIRRAAQLLDVASQHVAAEPTLALTAAVSAVNLLDGEVLVGEAGSGWLEDLQHEVRRLTREGQLVGAQASLAVGDSKGALRLAEGAAATDPYDETAVRLLLLAAAGAGEPARGLAAYERLRRTLMEELGSDPAPETRQAFLNQLAERSVADSADLGTSPRLARVAQPSQAMAGREVELALLRQRWARAVGGAPGIVLLCGEAGIGKTRLATEVEAMVRATGGTVLQARCYETERSSLLQPLVDALRPQILSSTPETLRDIAGDRSGSLALLVPEIVEVLGPIPRGVASPETERRLAFEALATVLRRLAARAPVLLMLDDLQAAGLSTLDALHLLARRAGEARLLVLATLRIEEGHEALSRLGDVAERIDVGPLTPEAVETLAAAAGQRPLASSIVARTHGHALFVVETLRALSEGEQGIPTTLTDAVTRRVARAGEDVEQLARAAAVLGASFEPGTLAGLLDVSAAVAARRCERLASARLAVDSGKTYEFVNDLVHEVLYATTPEPTRNIYHRKAADLLADRPEAAAPHAAASGQWERAAEYWLDAAALASSRLALPDAEGLLSHSLAAAHNAGAPELLLRAHLERGRVRETVGEYSLAMADFTEALALAKDHGLERWQMHAHRELAGDAATGMGQGMSSGMPHLEAALELAQRLGDSVVEAGLLARWAILASNRLQFVDALDFGERAVAAGRTSGDEHALALGLDGLKTVYAYTGQLTELDALTAELEVLLRRAGNLTLLQWTVFERAMIPFAAGHWDEARARVEEALTLARRSGRRGYVAWYLAHLGWIARLQGRAEDAVAHGRRSLDAPTTIHTWFRSTACAMQAANLLAADLEGGHDDAVRLLRAGLTGAEQSGAESYRLRCLAPLAELTGDASLLHEADVMLRSAAFLPGTAWLHGVDAYLSLARAWHDAGDRTRARQIIADITNAGESAGWSAVLEASGAYSLTSR